MSWRSYQSLTEGQLSVSGTIIGSTFEFGFSDRYFFFFLHKSLGVGRQTIGVGPYFTIKVPLLDLLAALSPAEMTGRSQTFEGFEVGEMDINSGRMAADDGEITRPILQLHLSLKKDGDAFFISMLGATGPVDPKSILEATPENMKACSFEASFWLRRDHIERMLTGHPLQAKLLEHLKV